MFKRNQNFLSATGTNAKASTYMTGFNNGSAVRASANARGQMSSQASGYMDQSNNLGGFAVVPSNGLDSNDSSPQVVGVGDIDLPPN